MCIWKKEGEKQECNAGETCCIYNRVDTVPSFDKEDHKQRSLANAPEHRKHWAKVKNNEKNN